MILQVIQQGLAILYSVLMFVNLGLACVACFFYIKSSRKSEQPWKNLKQAFAINMAIGITIYIMVITGQPLEPLITRIANTLLLSCLAVSSIVGVSRHDRL